MIIIGGLTKVVKFSLLIYFEKSKSDIIEWYKTSKKDYSSYVYWKFFVFFQWLPKITIIISQTFLKYFFLEIILYVFGLFNLRIYPFYPWKSF